MTNQERQGWFIVASLFITVLLLVGGGYDTTTVFIPALIKHFGWSRARVSMLPSMLAITFGLGSPLFGMLVDRVEARFVIVCGAIASGVAYLLVSQMNSFAPMLAAYLLLGAGISAGSLVPGAFVITNWFTRRRGLALGIFTAGTTAGAVLHRVADLNDLGSQSGNSALAVSAAFGFSALGKILMGLIADRVTGRIALGVNFIAQAFSLFLALYVIHTEVLVMFVVLFGLT